MKHTTRSGAAIASAAFALALSGPAALAPTAAAADEEDPIGREPGRGAVLAPRPAGAAARRAQPGRALAEPERVAPEHARVGVRAREARGERARRRGLRGVAQRAARRGGAGERDRVVE